MSLNDSLGINLLTGMPMVGHDVREGGMATNTFGLSGGNAALPVNASSSSHVAPHPPVMSGALDQLDHFPQPKASTSIATPAFGSTEDLLGDEIVEPLAAADQPTQTDASPQASAKLEAPTAPVGFALEPTGPTPDQPTGAPASSQAELSQRAEAPAAVAAAEPKGYSQRPPAASPEGAAAAAADTSGASQQHQQHQPPAGDLPTEGTRSRPKIDAGSNADELPVPPAAARQQGGQEQMEPPMAAASRPSSTGAAAADRACSDGGGGSQSLPSDVNDDGDDALPQNGDGSGGASGQASDGDERQIDSDRELVEEEDAFGDFADFTSASHFLPGGGGGIGGGSGGQTMPPPSASAAAAARAAAAAGAGGPAGTSSPSAHRHSHLGPMMRPSVLGPMTHGMLGGGGGGGFVFGSSQHHLTAASVSGAVSEHGSLAGEFSDLSHQSPPPSVAPSRGGGGRKSVASIASVGSRAGGDDDLGDYGSVVGSSVWRAPSQMATSSYAAAAGADDDFGDFTSDITSTSDFAPSTQPPSAVAVSGPGSVHPDDDFGSFASHRSTADDDEDDFGNFNAAPAAAAAGAAAAAAGGAAGAGPSGSGAAGAAGAATGSSPAAVATAGVLSPRDAAHPYHSTQSVGPVSPVAAAGSGAAAAHEVGAGTAMATGLLQLPPAELRQAVARALQPLLPVGGPAAGAPPVLPDEQVVSAAWAQLRRHVQGALADPGAGSGSGGGDTVATSVAAHNGAPLPPLPSSVPTEAGGGTPEDGGGRGGAAGGGGGGYAISTVRFTRPLRWKGSDSERRLLSSLGLSELAAQARALEAASAAEGPRPAGRGRADLIAGGGGIRYMGPLASFGDAPRRARGDPSVISAGLYRDTDCDSGTAALAGNSNGVAGAASTAAGGGGSSRSRGLMAGGGDAGMSLPNNHNHLGAGAGYGGTPRVPATGANGLPNMGGQQQQQQSVPHGGGG